MTNGAEFILQLRKDSQNPRLDADAFYQRLGLDLLVRVVNKTPVDTGRARGGWDVNFGRPSSFVPGDQPKRQKQKNEGKATKALESRANGAGQRAINRGTSAFAGARIGKDGYISNNVEYIEILEAGRRTAAVSYQRGLKLISFRREQGSIQAPAGMVSISIAEVERAFAGRTT